MGRIPSVLDARGQALPLVLGMIVIFSISIVTVITVSTATNRDAKRENAHDVALSVAENGVANALSVLSNATNPLSTTTLPSSASPQVDSVSGGTVSWYGSLSGDTWTITATSNVANPTGGGAIKRTVQADAEVGSTTINQAWNYVFADDIGCLSLGNSVNVKEPIYTRGNLCLNNSSKATGSPVYVQGNVDITSSASIGVSGTPIAEFHVGGGCRYGGSGSYTYPCTSAQHVYVTTQDQVSPGVTKPPLDLSYWYTNAKPGPNQACTSGSFPGGFDGDTTMNRSRADVNLFASNYDCTVTIGGTQVGRIAYTSGNPGSFVIDGTIFFDGNIVMSGSQKVLYSGRGTIYASGMIDLQGSQMICGAWTGSACDFTNWAPATAMLVLVSGSTTDDPSFNTGQSMQFQGGIYANGNYAQGSSAKVEGPKIGNTLTISGSSQSTFPAYTFLPPGAPQVKPVLLASGWKG